MADSENIKHNQKQMKLTAHGPREPLIQQMCVLQALEAEDAHNQKMKELMEMDERKRPYNSMYEAKAPTEEELEAFRMKQIRDEDPMAAYFSK